MKGTEEYEGPTALVYSRTEEEWDKTDEEESNDQSLTPIVSG